MNPKILFLFISILSLLSCDVYRQSSIGINSHVSYNIFDDTRHDEIKAMKEMGINFVRIDWQGKNLPTNQDKSLRRFDESLAYLTKYGIDFVIVFPTMPNNNEEIQPYAELIEFIAKRYNGKTKIDVNGKQYKPLAKYFQIGNEMHFQRRQNPQVDNPKSLWKINKYGALAVRKARPDAVTIFGAIYNNSYCREYVDWMCSYRDNDGTSIRDLFDIVSLHLYKDDIVSLTKSFEEMKEMIKSTPLADKPIWITECGMNTYEYTEKQQSNYITPSLLLMLSMGAEKCFWYTFRDFGGNLFSREKSINNREDYFGIIKPSVIYPSVSFVRNDVTNKAMSQGEALNQVLVGFPWKTRNFIDMPLGIGSKAVIENLKKTGLYIHGENVGISKVVKQKRFESNPNLDEVLYKNKNKSRNTSELRLEPSHFQDVKEGHIVRVYLDSIKKTSGKWSLDPKPAYYELRNVLSHFSEKCSNPGLISNDNGIYIWRWREEKNKIVYALWSISPQKKITGRCGNKTFIYTSDGKIKQVTNNGIIDVSQSCVFVVSPNEISFSAVD